MTAITQEGVARSDVVGSLLRPAYLRQTRQARRQGQASEAELHVREALDEDDVLVVARASRRRLFPYPTLARASHSRRRR